MVVNLEPLPVLSGQFRWEPWDAGSKPGRTEEPIRAENFVYVPGNFNRVQDRGLTEYSRSYLQRVAATGTYAVDTTWDPAPNNRLWKIRYDDTNNLLYVAGQFTSISAVTRTRLAAYTIADPTDPAINARFNGFAGPNGAVYAMALDNDNNLWVGGDYGTVGGSNRDGLARLDVSSTTVTLMSTPNTTIAVAAGGSNNIYIQDMVWDPVNTQMIVLLRNYATVGGATAKIFAIQKNGTINWRANPLGSSTAGFGFQVAVDSTQCYVALDGSNWAYTYRLTDGQQMWTYHPDGNVQGIATLGGYVFFGHHGDWVAPTKDNGNAINPNPPTNGQGVRSIKIVCVDRNGVLQDWRPEMRYPPGDPFGASSLGVFRIGKDDASGQLYLAGDFAGAYDADTDTEVAARRFAFFEPLGVVDPDPDPDPTATIKTNSFENSSGTDGTALTTANSDNNGAGDEVEVDLTGGSVTAVYKTASNPADGTHYARLHVPKTVATDKTAILKYAYAQPTVFPDAIFRISKKCAVTIMAGVDSVDRPRWSVVYSRQGLIRIKDADGALVAETTARIPINTWFRVAVNAVLDPSSQTDNLLELVLYDSNLTTVRETISDTNIPLGVDDNGVGADHTEVWAGCITPVTRDVDVDVDLWRVQDVNYFGQTEPPPPVAQEVIAQEMQPYGYGGVNNLAGDPNDIDVWHLGMDVGGYRRMVAGYSSHVRQKGLDSSGWRKTAALMVEDDPTNPGNTLVGWGCGFQPSVYIESEDGGDTFVTKVNGDPANWNSQSPLGPPENAILPHVPRVTPHIAYDASRDLRYWGTYKQGVYRVTRAGVPTRISMAPGTNGVDNYFITDIQLDPADNTRLLVSCHAGTGGSGGIYEITGANSGTGKTPSKITPAGLDSVWEMAFAGVGAIGGRLYAACDVDGIWRSAASTNFSSWTDISGPKVSKQSIWCTIDAYVDGADHVVGIGCHSAVKVDDNGLAGGGVGIGTRDNRFGCVYRALQANAAFGTIAWDYVCDPGSGSFPGGGDADVNVNSLKTGTRWSKADDNGGGTMLGRSGAEIRMFRWHPAGTPGAGMVAAVGGAGGIIWLSDDNATTWQAAPDGIVIGSTQCVFPDRGRANGGWQANQDLDCLGTLNLHEDEPLWRITPQVQQYSTGATGYGAPDGYVTLGEMSPPNANTSDGEILQWNGTNPDWPGWTGIGGWVDQGGTTNVNGLPNGRPLSIIEIKLANGNVRTIANIQDSGLYTRELRAGSWTKRTSFPDFSQSTGHCDIIAPNAWISSDGVVFMVVHHNLQGGLWRSVDYGVTWSRIFTNNNGGGNVFAKRGQSDVIYYTGHTDGKLRRIRNAATTANVDIITTFDRADSGDFSDSGQMVFWCYPATGVLPKLIVVPAPATSGTDLDEYVDIIDPDDPSNPAADDSGQASLNLVTNLVVQGGNILLGASGGSAMRVQLPA